MVSNGVQSRPATSSHMNPDRQVPMQVLCLGMPKTGTKTLKCALDILGIPCYHGYVAGHSHAIESFWVKALQDKISQGRRLGRGDFDQVLGQFGAASDMPPVAFAADLIEAYPEAKVILVERDINSWYESYINTIVPNMWHPLRGLGMIEEIIGPWRVWLFGGEQVAMGWSLQLLGVGFWGARSRSEMKQIAKRRYREHYEMVRSLVPKERRLEYNLRSGWKPLCEFLDLPAPTDPFPVANERQQFKSEIKSAYIWALWTILIDIVLVVACCASLAVAILPILSKI